MQHSMPQVFALNETAVLLQWSNIISIDINRRVHALANVIRQQSVKSIIDIIPAYSSLTIVFSLAIFVSENNQKSLPEFVSELIAPFLSVEKEPENKQLSVINIPVCYDERLNNDLGFLSVQHHIPVKEMIRIHTALPYYVYMLGFLPGFAYMGDVNKKIAFARKEKPVPVSAGAVAVAGKQTGIYSVDSPGGWNIFGYTPMPVFNALQSPPCLIEPGATVCFNPIDIETYYHMKNQAAT